MAKSKYFPDLKNDVDDADVEQIEDAFSLIEADFTEAKTYADSADAKMLESAKEYADSLSENYATAEQGEKADNSIQITDELVFKCDTSVGKLYEILINDDDEIIVPPDPGEDIPIITE